MPPDQTVLVIDDNQTVRRFIEGALRPLGIRVETAADGVEGLQRVASGDVDLILLDFVMPRMNGYHFCRTLEEKKLAVGVPVILLSSTEERVAEKMREHTRVVDFLPKPVKAGLLKEVVQRHLRDRADDQGADPAEQGGDEAPLEFDLSDDVEPPPGLGSPEINAAAQPDDVLADLRDQLQSALANGLAERLDDLAGCQGRDDMLGIIGETVASAVDDAMLQELIDRIRKT